MLDVHSKLEALEEEDTKGHTTPQFRQYVVEARNNAVLYCEFLMQKFEGIVNDVEGKKKDTEMMMKEIEKATITAGKAKFQKSRGK